MDNNFKNPFEADEEQLEMISLAPDRNTLPSLSNQPLPTYPQQPIKQVSTANLSQYSMLDTLESTTTNLQEQPLGSSEEQEDEPPLL